MRSALCASWASWLPTIDHAEELQAFSSWVMAQSAPLVGCQHRNRIRVPYLYVMWHGSWYVALSSRACLLVVTVETLAVRGSLDNQPLHFCSSVIRGSLLCKQVGNPTGRCLPRASQFKAVLRVCTRFFALLFISFCNTPFW